MCSYSWALSASPTLIFVLAEGFAYGPEAAEKAALDIRVAVAQKKFRAGVAVPASAPAQAPCRHSRQRRFLNNNEETVR